MTARIQNLIATILPGVIGIVEAILLWKFTEMGAVIASAIGILTTTLGELGLYRELKK